MKQDLIKRFFQIESTNLETRLRWLEKTLKQIPEGKRILDAGAGELAQKKYCKHLSYVSQDFGKYDGIGDSAGLQTKNWDNSKLDIISDITDIPEGDKSFDAIMCIEVFEHIPNPIKAIKEFSRLLVDDGYLIITAPFCSLTHFAPFHFYSGFNKYFYEKHLVENGFEIQDIQENGNFFDFLSQEINRIEYVSQMYGEKKISKLDKFLIWTLRKRLKAFSQDDVNSHELLNFGFQIFARKVS